jgi:hypothetical protein
MKDLGPVLLPQLVFLGAGYLTAGVVARLLAPRFAWLSGIATLLLFGAFLFHARWIYQYEVDALYPKVGRVNLYGYALSALIGLLLAGHAFTVERRRGSAA